MGEGIPDWGAWGKRGGEEMTRKMGNEIGGLILGLSFRFTFHSSRITPYNSLICISSLDRASPNPSTRARRRSMISLSTRGSYGTG
jgi:hypothetical protein